MVNEITGEALRDEAGEIVYPQLRDFTRNPEYPELKGLRELSSWQKGDTRRYLLVSDIEQFALALVEEDVFLPGGFAPFLYQER